MRGVEEARNGRRRNEWTGEEEGAMHNELTGSATSEQRKRNDTIRLMEKELLDAVRSMMTTIKNGPERDN